MSENTTPHAPSAPAAATIREPDAAPERRDRHALDTLAGPVWSLRKVAAVAVTAVALSGIGGAALAAASDGGSSGPGGRGTFGPPGQLRGQVPGQIGQVPGQIGQVPGQMGQVPGQTGQTTALTGSRSVGHGPRHARFLPAGQLPAALSEDRDV